MLADIESLLTNNRIFKQRNVDIGVVNEDDILEWGFSGVMMRGSGLAWDLRRSQPYECYNELDFKIRWAAMATAMTAISAAWKRCTKA